MEGDDVYPNQGEYFLPREPKEQVIARKKEKANTLEALKTIKVLLDHLDKRIIFYGSVDAMPEDSKSDPAKFMNAHNANEIVRDNLRSEREYIESLLDSSGVTDM